MGQRPLSSPNAAFSSDLATPVGVCSATAGKEKIKVGLGMAEPFYNSGAACRLTILAVKR